MQQDKKQKQRNTFISIWPKETGAGRIDLGAIPSENEAKVSIH